ncbi:VWA domain-containing protein, partial [Candidatus Bipolaricaulota bacterium]|nr:VWA domain-containing protein [Candidatus Bipolaricaulota bacterium]
VGEVSGYPGGIDISPFVSDQEEFHFVRLRDVPRDEDRSSCPGPSIDAVGAMGSLQEVETGKAFGSLELLPTGEISIMVGETPKNILIILDSSSSMEDAFEDSTKIRVAKEVLTELVDIIPDDALVGLRIFGMCKLSRLLLPMGPLERNTLRTQIQAIETGGPTPIAYALEQARKDFADIPDAKLILLVSDGQETCRGDPVAAARELITAGYELKIHVVGFAVEGGQGAREQLMAIAEASGGIYFDAESREELRSALRLSVQIHYQVYDQEGIQVFSGVLGEPGPRLPAGVYRVVIGTLPPLELESVSIQPQQTTTITLQRSDGTYSAEVK